MRRSMRTAAALAATTAAAIGPGAAAAAGAECAPDRVVTEYPIAPATFPGELAVAADGTVWFTEGFRAAIVRRSPDGAITEFTEGISPMPPYSMQGLVDVAIGPGGNAWFTEGLRNRVGTITPTGQVTEYSAGITGPTWTIVSGGDGNLWFRMGDQQIARMTPQGVVTAFTPHPGTTISELAWGADGALWFAEPGGLGRMTTSGTYTHVPLGDPPLDVPAVAAGPDGSIWFATRGSLYGPGTTGGRYADSTVQRFVGAGAGSTGDVAVDADSVGWFTGTDHLVRTPPIGLATTVCAGITPGSWIAHIAAGPGRTMWFTSQITDRIGRVVIPGDGGAAGPLTIRLRVLERVRPGGRAPMSVVVTNTGGAAASALRVTVRLPKGLVLDGRSMSANRQVTPASLRFTRHGQTAVFRPGALAGHAVVTLGVDARVHLTAPRRRDATVSARAEANGVTPVSAQANVRIEGPSAR